MEDNRRGYDLPYAVVTGTRIGTLGVAVVCTVLCVIVFCSLIQPDTILDWIVTLAPALAMLIVLVLPEAAVLCAVLHIVPEGIAITVLGKTVRRFPAEKIHFITAVSGSASRNRVDKIAVCEQTLEELTQLGYKATPKIMRIPNPRWAGEFAESYLYHRGMSLSGELNDMRKIIWLDWSPERLKLLLEMYPQAQWLDCTQKKLFDAQMK